METVLPDNAASKLSEGMIISFDYERVESQGPITRKGKVIKIHDNRVTIKLRNNRSIKSFKFDDMISDITIH